MVFLLLFGILSGVLKDLSWGPYVLMCMLIIFKVILYTVYLVLVVYMSWYGSVSCSLFYVISLFDQDRLDSTVTDTNFYCLKLKSDAFFFAYLCVGLYFVLYRVLC